MYRKNVLSYGAIMAQNSQLKKELISKCQSLQKFTELQNGLCRQIGNLLKDYQTKLTCSLGHFQCNIDHNKCNYVKPAQMSDLKPSMMKSRNQKTKDYHRQYDHMSYSRLIRKIDKLQGFYGLPPPFIH